jgi:hypothetical protein
MEENRTRGLAIAILGLGLIGLGIFFILTQIFHLDFWGLLWPFFIIVPGLLFFVGMFALGKNGAALAVPGSIVTMVGMILFYQNVSGHWASWAYAWLLIFPVATGLGIAIAGFWSDEPKTVRSGIKMAGIGFLIFMLCAIFFELLLNISGFRSGLFGQILLPLLLLGAGIVVLYRALTARRRAGED